MSTDLRTAAQMGLRALELRRNTGNPAYDEQADEAVKTLRAALAAEPQPVAHTSTGGDIAYGVVKWFDQGKRPRVGTPLYTAAPTAQPLTDEQIERLCEKACASASEAGNLDLQPFHLARAVERAHGIAEFCRVNGIGANP